MYKQKYIFNFKNATNIPKKGKFQLGIVFSPQTPLNMTTSYSAANLKYAVTYNKIKRNQSVGQNVYDSSWRVWDFSPAAEIIVMTFELNGPETASSFFTIYSFPPMRSEN